MRKTPKPVIHVEYRHVDCPDAEQRIKQAIKIIFNASRRTPALAVSTYLPDERRAA